MSVKKVLYTILVLLIPVICSAQYYVTGDDPGRLKWNFIDTESYRIIYPEDLDSLASVYGRKLEKYKIPVSRTSGYITGQGDGRLMPVVLHAYNDANGSVAWAPKRMDLFTLPSAHDPVPLPWSTMLSVHESRHVTQMQFGQTKALKPLNYIVGESWNILTFLLYPGASLANMEGDAVIAETSFTPSGRGRSADFLNYFWVSLDNGIYRDWFRWRYPSQKHYAPSYYALGYLTVGGFRYLYDHPYFISDALHYSAENMFHIGSIFRQTEKVSGKKFNDAFTEVCDTMLTLWRCSADKRKPYIHSEQLTEDGKHYTEYSEIVPVGADVYAIKKGYADASTLVRIDSEGNEKRVSSFSGNTGGLRWSESGHELYWSEITSDKRWSLKTRATIRHMNPNEKKKNDISNSHFLNNPSKSDEKGNVAVSRYHIDGRSSLEFINLNDRRIYCEIPAPDSLQIVENTWVGSFVYSSAISENGYGIYRVQTDVNDSSYGRWIMVLPPKPAIIKDLNSHERHLEFTCDMTGSNEFYHYDIKSGKLLRKTSLRYGGRDFIYSNDRKWLYYSSQRLNGRPIFRTMADSLLSIETEWSETFTYPIAEKITAQERAAAIQDGNSSFVSSDTKTKISAPERYRKFPHMFNIHSWAPVYLSVNNIMNMSYENLWQAVSLGASAILQNRLSTARGEFGYSAHKDPYDNSRWRNSGHIKFIYSGLYPVFEFRFDVNDRASREFRVQTIERDNQTSIMIGSMPTDKPYINGQIKAYIPFNLSSGGWSRGVIPQLNYRITNYLFNSSIVRMSLNRKDGSNGTTPVFLGYVKGDHYFRHYLNVSVRGYIMRPTVSSCIYPRWGIGLESGFNASIESNSLFSPMGYLYCYGYIPGIAREHGIRISATYQKRLFKDSPVGQPFVNILPRGYSDNPEIASWAALMKKNPVRVSMDYAIPIYIGDIRIGGNIMAVKRLNLTPHFDYSFLDDNGLWSAGLDITLNLEAIMTFEWPCTIGLTCSYKGGSALDEINQYGIQYKRWSIGPAFNVSF